MRCVLYTILHDTFCQQFSEGRWISLGVPVPPTNETYSHIIHPVAIKCMNLRRSARILAQTSPSIKRSEQDGTMDTVSSGTAGVPSSQDTTNNSVIRNSDHHTNDKMSNLRIRPRSVHLHDILDFNDTEQHCLISKCRTKSCKTCNILITDAHFTSNLTNKN